MMILSNQQKLSIKKKEYKYHDHDDLDYYGIMLMLMIITNPYQSKGVLKIIINILKAEEIKTKKLSVKQYLYKIMPYLNDLINDDKTNRNNYNE